MDGEIEDLIRYRLSQAEEALADALALLDRQSFRAAINRAYYAMFYAILALLNLTGHGTSKHSGAIALFDREFVNQGLIDKKFSKWLHTIFNLRLKSDYDELIMVSKEQAQETTEHAQLFVLAVKQYIDLRSEQG